MKEPLFKRIARIFTLAFWKQDIKEIIRLFRTTFSTLGDLFDTTKKYVARSIFIKLVFFWMLQYIAFGLAWLLIVRKVLRGDFSSFFGLTFDVVLVYTIKFYLQHKIIKQLDDIKREKEHQDRLNKVIIDTHLSDE